MILRLNGGEPRDAIDPEVELYTRYRSLLGCSLSRDAHQRATHGRARRSVSAHPSSLPVSRCQSLRGEPWVDARRGVGPVIRMGLKDIRPSASADLYQTCFTSATPTPPVILLLVACILQLLLNKYIISYSHFCACLLYSNAHLVVILHAFE